MSDEQAALAPPNGEFLVYAGADGTTQVQVRLSEKTVWLSQKLMAELYGKDVRTINEHLQNIFDEGELEPEATIRKLRIVRTEGNRSVSRLIDHYSLPAILAVGYRVRSKQGTRFRKWATARLDEFLVKGFVLDDERLKSGKNLGEDYFDELLERIRDIRASERRFYQKVTDIYAQCSADYDPTSDVTKTFYATVQNKLHWAIHGHAAAELIKERADAGRPNMGLTTLKNAPGGSIRKADIAVAKNYLSQEELSELNRIVTMYLDYAEDQARRRKAMTMAEWVTKLDSFLEFNERNVLTHAGKVSGELALTHAADEFGRYEVEQRELEAEVPSSDFDRLLAASKKLEEPGTLLRVQSLREFEQLASSNIERDVIEATLERIPPSICLEWLKCTGSSAARRLLAIALANAKYTPASEVLHELVLDPSTEGKRGSLIHALAHFDITPYFNSFINWVIHENFECAHVAFIAIRELAEGFDSGEAVVRGEDAEEAYTALQRAKLVETEEWRRELIDELLERFQD